MIRFCTRESILGLYFINIYIIFFITRKRHKYFNNEDGTKFPEWIIWFLSPLQTSFYTQMTCHLYFIRERYIYIQREMSFGKCRDWNFQGNFPNLPWIISSIFLVQRGDTFDQVPTPYFSQLFYGSFDRKRSNPLGSYFLP